MEDKSIGRNDDWMKHRWVPPTWPYMEPVKDATANVARASLQRLACGPDFVMLSGEDATALGFMAHGGRGCISVTSNVAPALCARFQAACLADPHNETYMANLAMAHSGASVQDAPIQ